MEQNQRTNLKINIFRKVAILTFVVVLTIVTNIKYSLATKVDSADLIVEHNYTRTFLKDVADAKSSIKCAMYMFKVTNIKKLRPNDSANMIGAAFANAVKRGVKVQMVLNGEERGTFDVNHKTAKILKRQGVDITFHTPDQRLHTKMCVIDGEITFLGSHNYTYSAMNKNSEISVRVKSKTFAKNALDYLKTLGI